MPKASTTPYTEYTFRYDYKDEIDKELTLKWITEFFEGYTIFDEIATKTKKPHLQGKVGKSMSLVQIKKLRLKTFEGSNYSIAKIDDKEKYNSYIAKDGNMLINNDDTFSAEFIEKSKGVHNEIIEKVGKKTSTKPFCLVVAEEFERDYKVETDMIRKFTFTDIQELADHNAHKILLGFIIKRLGKVAKVFDTNTLQKMYNGIKNYIIQGDAEAELRQLKHFAEMLQL